MMWVTSYISEEWRREKKEDTDAEEPQLAVRSGSGGFPETAKGTVRFRGTWAVSVLKGDRGNQGLQRCRILRGANGWKCAFYKVAEFFLGAFRV